MTDSESDPNDGIPEPFERHSDEEVGLEAVGKVRTVKSQEKEDLAVNSFLEKLNKKKKKRHKKRKKKKPKSNKTSNGTINETNNGTTTNESSLIDETNYFIPSDNRDYPYTVLLERIFRQIREKNPDWEKVDRMNLPPLSVAFFGGKKTSWGNFKLITDRINRPLEHVKLFFLSEMNTTGNMLKNGGIVFKGRWRVKQIESLLQKYRRQYITCHNCRKPHTTLSKDSSTRLYFLKCEKCGASRSVQNIKHGFKAATREERRAERFGR